MVQHTHTIQQSKTVQQKTSVAKAGEVEQKWFVVDATDCTLGRLASQIAMILMGKHRPEYTPHVDTGEYVVVINAEKVKMSGRKLEHRHYAWYNGYNRQKMESYGERLERKPTDLVHSAQEKHLGPTHACQTQSLRRHRTSTPSTTADPSLLRLPSRCGQSQHPRVVSSCNPTRIAPQAASRSGTDPSNSQSICL
jgi:large subunit ribosomal protein L13